ncbi:MAG: type II toxin-antitoxin system VapC family toxin [Rhodospirillales bacterium]
MRYLLDTNVLIWTWLEPERLPRAIANIIADIANEVAVSAASLWEIAIKQSVGKLKLPGRAVAWVPQALATFRFTTLNITGRHALAAGGLPPIHRDPFDRMLIAQAREEGLTLVTSDAVFKRYDVPVMVL